MSTTKQKPQAPSRQRRKSKPKVRRRNPRGRPTDYRAIYADQVREFLLYYENATDDDIAKYFGKHVSTINLWKRVHRKFSESIQAGKMRANAKVGSALYQAAVGFEIIEERAASDGEVVSLKKWIPGDVSAMKLFLTNRGTRHWRDKQETVVSNPDGSALGVPTAAQLTQAALVADLLYEKTMKEIDGREPQNDK